MYNQGPARGPERRPDQLSQLSSLRHPFPSSNAYPSHHPALLTSTSTSYTPNFVNSYGYDQSQLQAPVLSSSSYHMLGNNRVPLGSHRCTKAGCSYSAHSKKDIENHMMDRHFIFPPGWNERKGPKPDGDVASCMFMQVFRKKLDTPEAIAEWVAERKKRWPSLKRIQEKEQEGKDAKTRGELFMPKGRGTNRVSFSNSGTVRGPNYPRDRGHGRGRGRGHGRGRGRGHIHGSAISRQSSDQVQGTEPPTSKSDDQPMDNPPESGQFPPIHPERLEQVKSRVEDGDDDSNPDMDPVLDAIPSRAPFDVVFNESHETSQSVGWVDNDVGAVAVRRGPFDPNSREKYSLLAEPLTNSKPTKQPTRRKAAQPPKPRTNPFALTRPSRPPLLRSLLDRDVQITISNMSQAIRFLVANDCLQGVELEPGQAEEEQRFRNKVVVLNGGHTGDVEQRDA